MTADPRKNWAPGSVQLHSVQFDGVDRELAHRKQE